MPHICVKMLGGRTRRQKEELAENLRKTLTETLGCDKRWVSVSVEDYSPEEWQDQFREQVTENSEHLFIKPGYDPKELL